MTDVRDATTRPTTAANARVQPTGRLHLVRADDPRRRTARRPSTTPSSAGTSAPAVAEFERLSHDRPQRRRLRRRRPAADRRDAAAWRPADLARLHPRRRRRRHGRRDRGRRRQGADAAVRHPERRPDRDGRRPAGRALLRDEADPAGGRPERQERRLLAVDQPQRVRWNELRRPIQDAARRLLQRAVRLEQDGDHGYGRDGRIPLHRPWTDAHRRDDAA